MHRLKRLSRPIWWSVCLSVILFCPLVTLSARFDGFRQYREYSFFGLLASFPLLGFFALILVWLVATRFKRQRRDSVYQPDFSPEQGRQQNFLRKGSALLLILGWLVTLITVCFEVGDISCSLHPLAFVLFCIGLNFRAFTSASVRPWLRRGLCAASLLAAAISAIAYPPLSWLSTVQSMSGVVFRIEEPEPVLFLTIDDVPSMHTRDLIECLNRHHATATFFVTGEKLASQQDEELVERFGASGYMLGNHQWTDWPGILLSQDDFKDELSKCRDKIGSDLGSSWFRPAQGFFRPSMPRVASDLGYQTVLGDCFPWDFYHGCASFNVRWLSHRIRPGSVIILHDGEDRGRVTLETLEILLPEITNRGYQIRALPPLTKLTSG